jgi:RimJ/RimL family protein N-acetyltransferase
MVLDHLVKAPGTHAWAIQDLQLWPDRTRLHYVSPRRERQDIDYLLETGHPATQHSKTLVMGGTVEGVKPLLEKLPQGPWTMRETPAPLWKALQSVVPSAKVYLERCMETTRATFRPAKGSGHVRRLTLADVDALVAYMGAPPQAAASFVGWIQGACLYGCWERADGGELQAIASTFVQVPEVTELVGISTRKASRGKGYGTAVTSALTAVGLERSPLVTLTVLDDNTAAQRLYEKLGYVRCEDRIWVDHGANSSPVVD